MSARRELAEYTNSSFTATGRAEIQRLLDAYRAEVLREAAEALRAENRRILWATTPETCPEAEFLDRMAGTPAP